MKRILLAALSLLVSTATHGGEIHCRVVCKGLSDSADAVVYVDKIAGKTFPAPKEHAKMDQTNLTFVPHVLPVLAGTTVDFLNSDAVLHNVFSPDSCTGKVNLGTWPQGETRSHMFDKTCFAALLCIVHQEMSGFVAVLPTPYFAVSAPDGSYKISGIPDGPYTLKVWHPKLKAAQKSVTVHDNTEADFELAR